MLVSWLKDKISFLKSTYKFSIVNPISFKEVFGFKSTIWRVLSLVFLVFVTLTTIIVYVSRSRLINNYFDKNDISIERDQLEKQSESIILLAKKVENQSEYIESLQRILRGEVPINTDLDSITALKNDFTEELDWSISPEEKDLQEKISEEMNQVNSISDEFNVTSFAIPLKGVVSQKFSIDKHPGVDIVAKKGAPVHAALNGTVIYSGYTLKDGYIIILEHEGKVLTVYKHNESVLISIGDKVRQGDPIAFVGSSGENTDGPHLHFELWYNQHPLDPSDFIQFKN